MDRYRDLLQYNEILFLLYFNNKFVGYERWTDRGWMYSQDKITWNFKPKYACNQKIIELLK